MEEADLKPNFVEFFGGKGGGVPSSARTFLDRLGSVTTLFMYFCRMKRSIAESASSASTGTGGFLLSALYILFDATFPTFFMF